jgi:outer membrane biosynthesis protein TonB
MTDQGLSIVSAVLINVLIFTGMAFASMGDGTLKRPVVEPIYSVNVSPVELPKLGIKPPEKALPRLVEPAPPPPPETDKISLSREKKKQEELEKKKKAKDKKLREIAEKKARDEIKQKEETERQKEEDKAKKRKRDMKRALRKIKDRDKRADEDSPDGFADGDRMGNSTDPNARRNKATYINRVVFAVQRQFEIPTVIPSDQRARLKTTVWFKFDKNGKLVGKPRIKKTSGNRLFDQAAERALKKFSASGSARIPVPPNSLRDLRKSVLKNGLTLDMTGGK